MTIKEVAKLAGVSQAAVSRYLNGGPLSAEKRSAIEETINKTGYRPSTAARAMRNGRINQIGVMIPKLFYSDSVTQIVEGISETVQEQGYLVVLGNTKRTEEREKEYLSLMETNRAAGVIVMGTSVTPLRKQAYIESPLPIVVTGQNVAGLPCIYHDDYHAMYELAEMVIKRGRKSIVFIGVTDEDPRAGRARHEAMEAAWKDNGRDPADLRCEIADFNVQSGYAAMSGLLKRDPTIDGVICATDAIAVGATRALREAGRSIGKDTSIVGIGNTWVNDYIDTPLTTAHYFYKQCGEDAARMLLAIINRDKNDPPEAIRQICMAYKIIDRGSV